MVRERSELLDSYFMNQASDLEDFNDTLVQYFLFYFFRGIEKTAVAVNYTFFVRSRAGLVVILAFLSIWSYDNTFQIS